MRGEARCDQIVLSTLEMVVEISAPVSGWVLMTAFAPELGTLYSGKRLEAPTLLGEDLSHTTPSGALIFGVALIDSCIPQPIVITGIYRHKKSNEN